MYINSIFRYTSEFLDDKEYKNLLKPLTSMDLRRVSKFNLLSLYGSLSCLREVDFSKKLSIYVATSSACIDETYKVLSELKNNTPIMPFDFLNINTNNTGFHISKALNLDALSYTISTNELSFERALEIAYNDFKNGMQSSFLVGSVESSSINIPSQNLSKLDNSSWLYISDASSQNSIKIVSLKFITDIDDLMVFKHKNTILNSYASSFLDIKDAPIGDLFFALEFDEALYVALDAKKRGYVIELKRG